MKIVVINCHWDNRGDEAAIRAMIDELQLRYPDAMIYVQRALGDFRSFPVNDHVKTLPPFPVGGKKRRIQEEIAVRTNGKVCLTRGAKEFYKALKDATIVLHAPGGPSIGDIYLPQETLKLRRLLAVKKSGVPYVFFAPSMGPFKNKERNPARKEILEGASLICLREEVSKKMIEEFLPTAHPIVTLDSAFQHPINYAENEEKFSQCAELKNFVGDGGNVIGMTVTDLQWNSLYKDDGKTEQLIRDTFTEFVAYLTSQGYKILFIPQLFGGANDYDYMKSFAVEGCFVMDDCHDCYFQQYIISRLRAVIGMRYHSNIFSAKMGTPFISVSYEQKMVGFMTKAGLMQYCINIQDLSIGALKQRFMSLVDQYNDYKAYLDRHKDEYRKQATKTTNLVCEIIDESCGE